MDKKLSSPKSNASGIELDPFVSDVRHEPPMPLDEHLNIQIRDGEVGILDYTDRHDYATLTAFMKMLGIEIEDRWSSICG